MGTKWKNTIKQVTEFAEKNKHSLIGLLMIAVACVLLFEVLIRERYFYRPTSFVWIFGIFVNVFLGTGIVQFLRLRFSRKYENWTPADESFFDDWKGEMEHSAKGNTVYLCAGFSVRMVFNLDRDSLVWFLRKLCAHVYEYGYGNHTVCGLPGLYHQIYERKAE